MASRDAPLMADLFERYLEDHARPHKKASSVKDDERLIRCLMLPAFRRRKVAEVMRADVDARTIAGAHVEVISGAGHMSPLTHPGPVNRIITAHLKGARRVSKQAA